MKHGAKTPFTLMATAFPKVPLLGVLRVCA